MKILIGIDIQKDFVEGGSLSYGYPKKSNTTNVIDLVRNWREKSINLTDSVILTKDTHDATFDKTLEGQLLPKHCEKNTKGWEFADYNPADDSELEYFCDEVIQKRSFGTFKIVQWIKEFEERECEEVDEIQIVGYDMAVCVLANAVILRAAFPNKRIVVLKDYCGCINKQTFDAAVIVLTCQQIEVV